MAPRPRALFNTLDMMFPLGLVEHPGELVAASQMRRGLRHLVQSTSHALGDNGHEGNSPECGIYRKFDVESSQATVSTGCATCLGVGVPN